MAIQRFPFTRWTAHLARPAGELYARLRARFSPGGAPPSSSEPEPEPERPPYRYVVAVLLVVVATSVRLALPGFLGTGVALILFYPAVTIAALYGGFRPGLVAAALSCLAADYFFLGPGWSLVIGSASDIVALAVFFLNCVLISSLAERMHRAHARSRRAEARGGPAGDTVLGRLERRAAGSAFAAERIRAAFPIGLGFAFALAALGGVGAVFLRNAAALKEADQLTTHTHVVIGKVDRLLSDIEEAETGQRGFLITGDQRYLKPYEAAQRRAGADLASLRRLTSDNPRQQQRWAELEAPMKAKLAELRRAIDLRRTRGYAAAQREVLTHLGTPTMQDIRRILGEARDDEERLLRERIATKDARMRRDLWTGLGGGILAVGLLTIVFILLRLENIQRELATGDLRAYRDRLEELVAERTAALSESERRFRTMADAIPQLAWIARADGWLYWYNRRWYEYTGATPEQMEGWGWQKVHDPAELPKVLEQWKAAIAAGEPFEMTFPLRGNDGVFRPFLTRAMPLKDDQGRVLEWFGTNTDISVQKQAEEALRQAKEELDARVEQRTAELARVNKTLLDEIQGRKEAQATLARNQQQFRTLVEHSPDIIARHDRGFRHMYISPAIAEVTGLPLENFLGKTDREAGLAPELADKMEAAFREVFETGKEAGLELDYTIGSKTTHFDTVIVPELDKDGRVASVLEVSRDITDRKRVEMEVELLLAATKVVSESPDYATALQSILGTICRLNGWEYADAFFPSADGSRLEFVAEWTSRPEEFRDFIEATRRTVFARGEGPTGLAWKSQEPVWHEDIFEMAESPRLRAIVKAGFRGALAVPVSAAGQVMVVMNFFMRRVEMLQDKQRIEILHAMGHQLGAFLLRKRVEEERETIRREFLEAQKLEAVGRLAGGVAHDFANVLSAIVGTSELLLAEAGPGEGPREDLRVIRDSALQGVSLIKQLLAIGRSRAEITGATDPNPVISGMEQMLRRVLPERVRLELRLGRDARPVGSDRGHLEQIVMNLVVNARDAMPDGGRLVIGTAGRTLGSREGAELGLAEGDYTVLTVSDTGVGMPPEVKERIFEPFFTTKPAGVGTGLGLATVYHIMTMIGGRIRVDSEPGKGTTFRLYFPRSDSVDLKRLAQEATATDVPSAEWARGTETVLWVEDDPVVRRVAQEILAKAGYTVLSAESGARAKALAREHRDGIRLLLTDVQLGDADGFSLARDLSKALPGVPVAYVSGYSTREIIAEARASQGFTGLIAKPFTIEALLKGVRRALARGMSAVR